MTDTSWLRVWPRSATGLQLTYAAPSRCTQRQKVIAVDKVKGLRDEVKRALEIGFSGMHRPSSELLEEAAEDVPHAFRNLEAESYIPIADPSAEKVVSASKLVGSLARLGHMRAAAAWAVWLMIKKGRFAAEFAEIRLSPSNATVVDSKVGVGSQRLSIRESLRLFLIPAATHPVPSPQSLQARGRSGAGAAKRLFPLYAT